MNALQHYREQFGVDPEWEILVEPARQVNDATLKEAFQVALEADDEGEKLRMALRLFAMVTDR